MEIPCFETTKHLDIGLYREVIVRCLKFNLADFLRTFVLGYAFDTCKCTVFRHWHRFSTPMLLVKHKIMS